MVNLNNGILKFDNKKFTIKPGLKRDEFVKSDLYNDILDKNENEFSRYIIKPQLIVNQYFSIVLIFNKNNIWEFVQLCLTDNKELPTWDKWSEDEELKRKKMHDSLLKKAIGRKPYKYDWGEIISNYDPRSGSSLIALHFKNDIL